MRKGQTEAEQPNMQAEPELVEDSILIPEEDKMEEVVPTEEVATEKKTIRFNL